jgi:glutathione S-transferase
MYRLYSFAPSGNSYKVRLLMTQLGLPFELIECDVRQQGTRTPEYLAKNPDGKVPLLELAPNVLLSESGAMLLYQISSGTSASMDVLWPIQS